MTAGCIYVHLPLTGSNWNIALRPTIGVQVALTLIQLAWTLIQLALTLIQLTLTLIHLALTLMQPALYPH